MGQSTTQSDDGVLYDHSLLRVNSSYRWSEEIRPRLLAAAVVVAALAAAAFLIFRPGDQASAGVDLSDPHAWIEHGLDGEVLQINATTGEITARLEVGEAGAALSVAPHGGGAVVLNNTTGLLTLISGQQLQTTAEVPLELTSEADGRALEVYGSPDPSRDVVVVDEDQVLIVDPQTRLVDSVLLAEPLRSTAQTSSGKLLALSADSLELLQLNDGGFTPIVDLAPPINDTPEGRELVAAGGQVFFIDPARLWSAQVFAEEAALGTALCMTSAANGAVAGGSGPFDQALLLGFNARSSTLALVDGQGDCTDVALALDGDDFGRPVAHDGYVYVPDYAAGRIHVVDLAEETQIARLPFGAPGARFDLEIIGSTVWANEPLGRFAAVVEAATIRPVPKVSSIVAGAVELDGSGDDGEAITGGDVAGGGLRILGDSGERVLAAGDAGDFVDTTGAGGEPSEDLPPDLEGLDNAELLTPTGVGIAVDAPGGPEAEPVPPVELDPQESSDLGVEQTVLIANFGVSASTATVGEVLRFTDFSSGSPTSWTWDFGDGTGAQEPDVEKAWDSVGTYRVTLTVTNLAGDTSTQSTEVTVVPDTTLIPPTADFSFDRNTIEEGETISFVSRSTGEVTSLEWNFGDGATSNEFEVTHRFDSAGTYTVTLSASNSVGTSSASTTITVVDGVRPPQAVIAALPADIVTGQFVTLRSASLNEPTTLGWDFGDGTRATGESVRHQWDTPGTYRVRLEVENSEGADSTFVDVRVAQRVEAPVSQFTQTATEVLVDETVTFTSLSLNDPTKLIWDFGDGTGTRGERVSKSWTSPGTYNVTLRATNDAGTNRTGVTVTVVRAVDPPVASFTVTPAVAAVGDLVTVSDTSGNAPTSWSWDFGDTGVSSLPSTTHTYTAPGVYNITLNVSNEGGSSSDTQQIVIKERPSANFRWERQEGRSVQFTDTSWDGPETWSWDFGDGSTSTDRSPEHTFARNGTYAVTLVVANDVGASEPRTLDVVIQNRPVADFSWEIVGDRTVKFSETSSNSPTEWLWDFGDGSTSSQRNPEHTFDSMNTFEVTLVATSAAGSSNPVSKNVQVTDPVVAVAECEVVGRTVVCDASGSENAVSYRWSSPDAVVNTTARQVSTTLAYQRAGRYDVTLTVESAGGATDEVTVRAPRVLAGLAPRVTDVDVDTVEGDLVRLEASFDRGPTAWEWDIDGAQLVEGGNSSRPLLRVPESGTYEGTVRASNPFGTDTDPVEFSVEIQVTEASFTVQILDGNRVRLINTSTAENNATVEWRSPGATAVLRSDDGRHVVDYPAEGGSFTVSLEVSDANGSSTSTAEIELPEVDE